MYAKPPFPLLQRGDPLCAGGGLVLATPLYEGVQTTANDLSGNRNNGTLAGSSIAWAGGQFGYCLSLPNSLSDDWVDVPYSASLNPSLTGLVSVSCWVKLTTLQNCAFVTKWSATAADKSWLLYRDDGGSNTFSFVVNQSNNTAVQAKSNTTITAGVWYHVVGVADGSNVRVYVNGREDTASAVTYNGTLQNDTGTDVVFGRLRASDTTYPLQGYLDGILVFNRALSAGEVGALYFDSFRPYRRRSWRLKPAAAVADFWPAYAAREWAFEELEEELVY
jgi:hypothetical protein